MPYHVEVRRSFRRAWAFNLSRDRLRGTIIDPWLRGRQLELGDRRWEPRESALRILEGPSLDPAELAYGQGWNAAERGGEDVTRRVLKVHAAAAPGGVAVLAETAGAGAAVDAALRHGGLERSSFEGAGTVVVAVASEEPDGAFMFEVGRAIGAFGARALVVTVGGAEPPAPFRGLVALAIDPADPATLHALELQVRQSVART
jgi:hypothetical protein